jgi:hypothetical protein
MTDIQIVLIMLAAAAAFSGYLWVCDKVHG